jgi:cytochrome c oxidase subunit 2
MCRSGGARRWPIVIGALLLMLLASGCQQDLPQSTLDPAGRIAREQDALWDTVFPIAVVVFVLVEAALIFSVVRFRDRGDDGIPQQVAGNTRLEILWTLIPAVILAGIAVPTIQTLFELAEVPQDDPLEVRVIGKQYWWEFEYLNEEGESVITATDLHIPTDRSVYLSMQSLSAIVPDPGVPEIDIKEGQVNRGVIHSFWVPRLAGKQDVVPHHTRNMTIEADEPGTYEGQCAEFCGLSHARMRFNVIAHEPADFQQWLDDTAQPAEEPTGELAQQGAELFATRQCIACHAIEGYVGPDGQEANLRIGPNLTHFASRTQMAGGIIDVTTENIQRWLADPQAVKPGAQMPNLQLDDSEIDALTAYLQSLE